MTLSHIVAVSQNDVIGVNNTLPWDIPEDMKFFREKTKNRALIMGRKTFESVGHPLPYRLNVVVTRQKDYKVDAPNVVVVPDLQAAIEHCKGQISKYGEEIFIIGGGEIFKESMGLVDVIYLTRIHRDFPGDIKYPAVDQRQFDLVERRDRTEPVPFSFLTYHRRA
ncbi:MAG TPA: dihydrofolate reductase [Bdellovibrionales bacterium]|nr:dihydrofolate reductase [Bdellovibrionales bacterium]